MNLHTTQWQSLKTRVTFFTLAIFVIGLWSLAFYASRMLREDMQRVLGEQQFSTVSILAAGINDELDGRLKALEQVAARVTPAILGDTPALQTLLEQIPVFQGLFNGGTFATRLDGIATASIPRSAGRFGVNYMDRDYIAAALNNGKSTVGKPVQGKVLHAPVIALATPIRNPQGQVIGALVGVIELSKPNFLDRITQGSYGKSGAYLLAAPQHDVFIIASDKSRIMRTLPTPGANPLHDRYAQGYDGYGVLVNFRGEEELTAAKGIPVAGWFMGVAVPAAEAFAPIHAMQQRMLLSTILLTLLAGGLTWWMLRRQLSPMLSVVETLATLSEKNQPLQPLPVTRQDEIGQMIAGFNRLLETLAQREDALKTQQVQIKLAAQVFEQGREGVTISDPQGNIVLANTAFTAISGYTEAEMLGKNWRILSSERHSPEFHRAMWDTIDSKDAWSGEIWNHRKDGSEYPAWLAISTMRDEQGQITHYLGNLSDLSDAKAAETRIQWLSHFDALTGLPNRTLLMERAAHAISAVQRANQPMTMILLGIDHLKKVTDTLGHNIGDELLIEMARRLGNSVGAHDTVACLSGNEFVLLLPGTSSALATQLASDLLRKLAQPCQLGIHELTVTASIGIASYPENGGDFNALFKAVEIALHRAQADGHGTFQLYNEDMYQQVIAHDRMVKALHSAAALAQFQLLYQPLVDLQTGQICGLEALLRWQHPELGSVSPDQFIPLAEESGLINGVGEWVLRRACSDIRIWLDKGIKVPPVAVNISPLQFRDMNLIAQVKGVLSESQIDPKLLYLEVTEGALMDDVQRNEAMLRELKALGIKLSLDDFGTGYSSLSYLKRFPFDKVKIDRTFIGEIATSQSDNLLVNVIISMAHGLGLKVIAEGVETEAQCEILRTHVCDEIQGYFFSKPISAQAIDELFTEGRQLPPHLLRLRKPQRTLLLVDDEPNIVASLKRLFRRDGHVILTANSGLEGLDVLSKHKVDVIISDQRMPGMTGVEFLRAAKVNYPDTIRIVLSGYTELQSVTDAINEGAVYRFLTKPWDDEQLREHIHKAFEYKELLEENQRLDITIRTTNQELVASNRQLSDVLEKTRHQIERDETSLAIVREALQHIPLPVIGLDDEGLTVFVNAAAQRLFADESPLLGVALAYALPAVNAAIANAAQGVPSELMIEHMHYRVTWNAMGANSRSRGKLLTLTHSPN